MTYKFTVTVSTDTKDHAQTVMTERLGVDEDYGFDYQITDWELVQAPEGSSDPVETQRMSPSPAGEAWAGRYDEQGEDGEQFPIVDSLVSMLDAALKHATAITSTLMNEVKR